MATEPSSIESPVSCHCPVRVDASLTESPVMRMSSLMAVPRFSVSYALLRMTPVSAATPTAATLAALFMPSPNPPRSLSVVFAASLSWPSAACAPSDDPSMISRSVSVMPMRSEHAQPENGDHELAIGVRHLADRAAALLRRDVELGRDERLADEIVQGLDARQEIGRDPVLGGGADRRFDLFREAAGQKQRVLVRTLDDDLGAARQSELQVPVDGVVLGLRGHKRLVSLRLR